MTPIAHPSHEDSAAAFVKPVPAWMLEVGAALREIRLPPMPLSEFLLPDDHPDVLRYREERIATKTKGLSGPGTKDKDLEWEIEHYESYREIGLPWPPTHYPLSGFTESVAHMPERQAQLAWYAHQWWSRKAAREGPHAPPVIVDINMSMGFVQRSLEAGHACITLVSSAKPLFVHEGGVRDICGLEVLHLQGLPPSQVQDGAAADKNSNLIDLGGNAFNGFVCSAVMLSILSALDRAAVAVLLGLDAPADADAGPEAVRLPVTPPTAPPSPTPVPSPPPVSAGRDIWEQVFTGDSPAMDDDLLLD